MVFGSIWNFLKRHRRKFFFTGALVGGVYFLSKYARKKLQEIQEREATECLNQARRQHHFDSNQRTCNMTVLSMLPSLREALSRQLNTEELTTLLKDKPANKVEIWETLKIDSFTRTITAVYSCCMLIVVLRVQLNIIGGYMYLDTLDCTQEDRLLAMESQIATPNVQQRYLAAIQYLVDQGLSDLIIAVRTSVKKVIGEVPLKEHLSLKAIQEIINSVRQEVEFRTHQGYHDASTSSLCRFMAADNTMEAQAGSRNREDLILNKLNKETKDMLESGDFHSVLTMCLDTAFIKLVDRMAEYFKAPFSTKWHDHQSQRHQDGSGQNNSHCKWHDTCSCRRCSKSIRTRNAPKRASPRLCC